MAVLLLAPSIAIAQHRSSHTLRSAALNHRMLGTQVALDRAGFSPGEIDGLDGAKTGLALISSCRGSRRHRILRGAYPPPMRLMVP